MRWLGLVVAVGGLLLSGRSALLLAGYGRPRRGPQPPLVIAGPYVRVRNPLLAGLILAFAGHAIACPSAPSLIVALAAPVAAHLWLVRVEEPRLRERFGEAYAAYLDSVPRWVPRIWTAPPD